MESGVAVYSTPATGILATARTSTRDRQDADEEEKESVGDRGRSSTSRGGFLLPFPLFRRTRCCDVATPYWRTIVAASRTIVKTPALVSAPEATTSVCKGNGDDGGESGDVLLQRRREWDRTTMKSTWRPMRRNLISRMTSRWA
jgi:hypothetical protein